MNHHLILFSSAMLAASACTVMPQQAEPYESRVILRAYQEGAAETRTAVVDGGTQVFWEPGDAINVFFKGASSKFVSLNSELASVADFSGSFSGLVGANEGVGSGNRIWGLYPYRADASSDGQSVTTTLPDIQTACAGSFSRNTHITLAYSYNLDLAFYNVCGGLRFSLTQEGIKSVTFEGNNAEVLAGRIKIATESGVPAIQEVSEGKTAITLKAPSGTTFQTGQWYYIAALPGSLESGFKMTFYRDSDSAILTSTSSVSFRRGRYGSLANADEDLIFKGQGGDTPSGEVISFADEKVKAKLVAAFDTSGDGELSYEEAAAVTSIEGVFGAIKTYKSFNEFQYFTNVTTIPDEMFKDWNLLTSIVIPESVTSIGHSAFYYCMSVTSIVIPEGVSIIGDRAFLNCSGLTSVVIPNGVPSIGDETFAGCTSLASIVIPESVTRIGSYAFSGCKSLTSIIIPESMTSIGDSAFRGCTSLSSIIIPNGVPSIGDRTFEDCTSLASIVIPESVTRIGHSAFSSCRKLTSIVIPESVSYIENYTFEYCLNLTSIVIPESVAGIGLCAFHGCQRLTSIVIPESVAVIDNSAFDNCSGLTSIYCLRENPPLGGMCMFDRTNNCPIYVPAGSVEAYKSAYYWSEYAVRIQAIPVE